MTAEFAAAVAAYGDGIRDLEIPLLRHLGVSAPSDLVTDAGRRLELS